MFDFRNSDLILEARKSKFIPRLSVLTLLAVVLYYVSSYVSAVPLSIVMGILLGLKVVSGDMFPLDEAGKPIVEAEKLEEMMLELFNSVEGVLATLFLTAVQILVCIVFCKFIEKRTLYSMGFVRKKAFLNYLSGLFIGFFMFFFVYLICVLTGAIEFNGINSGVDVKILLLFFLGFLIQGASEEVFLRGFYMISAARKAPLWIAVVINSFLFSFMHFANSGFNTIAFANLVLFGIFASLYVLRSGSIWGICAIHSIWNFAQGNLFGCSVSGMNVGETLILSEFNELRGFTNGGIFGPEGGVAVTLVLVIAIMFVVFLPGNKMRKKEENEDAYKGEV